MRVEEAPHKAVLVGGKTLPSLTAILLPQGPGKSSLAVVPAQCGRLSPQIAS